MPITPFHFGPGVLLHAASPRRASFLAFCAANVLIDLEPLYFLYSGQFPLHRGLHSLVGASLAVVATVALFAMAQRLAPVVPLPDVFGWRRLRGRAIALGAGLGGYSHVVLDSVMHDDMQLFAPFSSAHPLLGLASVDTLHGACVACAALGLAVLGARRLRTRRDRLRLARVRR